MRHHLIFELEACKANGPAGKGRTHRSGKPELEGAKHIPTGRDGRAVEVTSPQTEVVPYLQDRAGSLTSRTTALGLLFVNRRGCRFFDDWRWGFPLSFADCTAATETADGQRGHCCNQYFVHKVFSFRQNWLGTTHLNYCSFER
jgi:hypothetical protein